MWLRKIWFRYLLSFLIVFLIPISVLGAIYQRQYFAECRENTIEQSKSHLQQFAISMDIYFNQMYQIAQKLSRTLFPTPEKDVNETIRYCQQINNEIMTSTYFQDVLSFRKNTKNIFTSAGTVSKELFAQTNGDFLSALAAIRLPTLYQQNADGIAVKQGLYFIVPLNGGDYVCFLFKSAFLQRTFGFYSPEALQTCLVTEFGTTYPQCEDAQVSALLRVELEKRKEVFLNTDTHCVNILPSDTNGLYFVSYIRTQDLFQRLNRLNHITLAILLLTTAVGIAVIFLLTNANYTPIHRLQQMACETVPATPKLSSELDMVSYAFSSLASDTREMQTKQISQSTEDLYSRLFIGEFSTESAFERALAQAHLTLTQTRYQVLIIHFRSDSRDNEIAKSLLLKRFKDSLLCPGCRLHALPFLGRGDYLLVLSADAEGEKYVDDIPRRIATLFDDNHIHALVTVGNKYPRAYLLQHSFMEAEAALENRYIDPNKQVLHYRELPPGINNRFFIPRRNLKHFKQRFWKAMRKKRPLRWICCLMA